MCIVSNIGDGFAPTSPWQNPQPTITPTAQPINIFGWPPLKTLDKETLEKFKEIIDRLDALEKAIGVTECKDEKKEAFFNELQALVNKYKAEEKE